MTTAMDVPPLGARRVDFGRRVLRVRVGPITARLDLRTMLVTAALTLLAAVVAVLSLGLGDIHVPVTQVLQALFAEAPHKAELVVTQWRLPRTLLALVLGAALGVSGAIFQSLTDNPLGSPDVMGFSAGSYTGAVLAMVLLPASQTTTAAGALAGGAIVAIAVYLLSWRGALDGASSQGFRIIVIGIALSAMLSSVTSWIMLYADLRVVMMLAVWGAGTLNGTAAGALPVAVVTTVVCLVTLVAVLPHARVLESGSDTARSLGIRVQPVRFALIAAGVVLVAVPTAIAGPIAFVALVAPQLAGRLTRTQGLDIWAPAAMGAVLLIASDTLARLAFAPRQLPVGIVTVCLGGAYLIWLLIREARRR